MPEPSVIALGNAIIALTQEPVNHAEYKGWSRQRGDGARVAGMSIKNDELATQCDERDKHNGLDLDDARSAKGNPNNRMLEFHGDEQRHDHAQKHLKDFKVLRIHGARDQPPAARCE